MLSNLTVTVNGAPVVVPLGATVAVAMAIAGAPCRTSVSGEPRGPLCGMGVCFECRVTINGIAHCRSCQAECAPEMRISTDY